MSEPSGFRPSKLAITIAAVLAVHGALLAYTATRYSPTFDEAAYLPAGLSHWEFRRFDLYRASPHLVRLVAALPVLASGPKTDWARFSPGVGRMPEYAVGQDFIRANGADSFRHYTLARWACIPFSLLGASVCFLWARDLYGVSAGVFATVLWCFDPNILGHAALITPDIATASLSGLGFYLLWKWLRQPAWSRAATAGAVLGLLLLTRSNAILLFGFWPLAWTIWRLASPRQEIRASVEFAQLVLLLCVGLYILNLGYLFEGSFRRLGDYTFASGALAGTEGRGNRFIGTSVEDLPVPLPVDYVLGIDTIKRNFESNSKLAYLGGKFRKTGWWYYYLYGLAVKVPVGTWLLVLLAAIVGWRYRAVLRDELFVLGPALCYLAFTSSQTGLNSHVRYVLPIAPFVFVWASKMATSIPRRHLCVSVATACLVMLTMASSLLAYPHNLSYFNELAGGAEHGHDHLLDSNIDWGQDLVGLKEWIDRHPEACPLGIAYFGSYSPSDVGIPFQLPPMHPSSSREANQPRETRGPRPGWYAVSVNFLRGYQFAIVDPAGERVWLSEEHFTYFRRLRPVDRAGDSIYIYHVTRGDADKLRKTLGYPLLAGAES